MNRFRALGKTQRGALLALLTAGISGLSIYLNAFGVKLVPDAAVYTTAKNGVAAVILVGLALALGAGREARVLDGRRRLGLVAIAVIGGSIPFVLFFSGLAMATAPTAAFIQKTLFVWVALLAMPLLGERLGLIPVVALGVLLAGQAIIAPPSGMGWGPGETMIAAATLLWALEVILAKRLLVGVSAPLLGASRMGIGLIVLLGYLAFTGRLGGLGAMSRDAMFWILVTGVLLAGYVTTWFAALRLAPATTVTSILVAGAVVTGALSAVSKGVAPDPGVVFGYLLILAAVALVIIAAAGRPARADAPRALAEG
jgi:drug/metabolite transporter (DMT)-like permease